MKSLNKIVLLSFCILGFIPVVRAQSLEALLISADSTNLELKAIYQEYLAALEKAPQISQLPDPEVGFGVFISPAETRLGPQWVRLSASQMFPWPGTLKSRKNVALAMARPQYEKVAATRLLIHYKIKKAYFKLYDLQHKQAIMKHSLEVFNTLASVATAKVESGQANIADVLRIQIRIKDIEEEIAILKNQEEKPTSIINELVNRPSKTALLIADTLGLATPPGDIAAILEKVKKEHPVLRMYTLQQDISQKSMALNNLEGKPSIMAGVDYIAVGKRNDANPSGNGQDIFSPKVGIRIPIYRDKFKAKEQEEKLKINAVEVRKQNHLLQFRSAIEQAYTDIEDGHIRFALAHDQKTTTLSVIDLLLEEYSTDGSRFIDLMQLENQLIRYDLMALHAIVTTQIAKSEIERFIPQHLN